MFAIHLPGPQDVLDTPATNEDTLFLKLSFPRGKGEAHLIDTRCNVT